uniref:Tc1-like transposase DDE domain-containing protein n=1 Tax=Caenorhabditis japonica TaxID=281687 RepID=A0A8R1E3Z8_CAEJA
MPPKSLPTSSKPPDSSMLMELDSLSPTIIPPCDPVNYGQKNKECSGRRESLVSVIKETSSEPLPTLRKVSTFFVSFFRNRRRSHTFQQDDAAINSSNFTKNWLASKGIKVLDWPACSPGLNPIENLWEMLVPCVYQNRQKYNNIQAFKTAVQREWDAISVDEPKKLVATRPNRVVEVI